MKLRTAQSADRILTRLVRARGDLHAEIARDRPTDTTTIVERSGRIVAVGWHRITTGDVCPPREPVPVETSIIVEGDDEILVGGGIAILEPLDRTELHRLHRLLRTLLADELGVRWTVVEVPLPPHPVYDASGTVQQIAAGALRHPPVEVPLTDGYWPHAVTDHRTVLLARRAPD